MATEGEDARRKRLGDTAVLPLRHAARATSPWRGRIDYYARTKNVLSHAEPARAASRQSSGSGASA